MVIRQTFSANTNTTTAHTEVAALKAAMAAKLLPTSVKQVKVDSIHQVTSNLSKKKHQLPPRDPERLYQTDVQRVEGI